MRYMDMLFDKVLVRLPGKSYKDCHSKNPLHDTIDIEKTLAQHRTYVDILKKHGIEVRTLPALESYPDSIFIQDTALVGERSKTAVICRSGLTERRGEEKSVEEYFKKRDYHIKKIRSPGTLEGGDILVTDKDKIFVGLSERTNESGIDQLSEYLPEKEVVKVPVSEVFHLLSGVNFLGDGTLAVCPDIVEEHHFEGFDILDIPKADQSTKYENKPINLLYLGEKKIMISKVYDETIEMLEDEGYTVIETDISEFWKGDAGMTCPMLPFYHGI